MTVGEPRAVAGPLGVVARILDLVDEARCDDPVPLADLEGRSGPDVVADELRPERRELGAALAAGIDPQDAVALVRVSAWEQLDDAVVVELLAVRVAVRTSSWVGSPRLAAASARRPWRSGTTASR